MHTFTCIHALPAYLCLPFHYRAHHRDIHSLLPVMAFCHLPACFSASCHLPTTAPPAHALTALRTGYRAYPMHAAPCLPRMPCAMPSSPLPYVCFARHSARIQAGRHYAAVPPASTPAVRLPSCHAGMYTILYRPSPLLPCQLPYSMPACCITMPSIYILLPTITSSYRVLALLYPHAFYL